VAFYDIYVSDNGGAFVLWRGAITQTVASFVGLVGRRYGFYSVATDRVGNQGATPSGAQATTIVGEAERGVWLPLVLRKW
jgi:hypothetical protein